MNVLTKLKSLVNGFGKENASVEEIADISKIETAQSPLMREKNREWYAPLYMHLPVDKLRPAFFCHIL